MLRMARQGHYEANGDYDNNVIVYGRFFFEISVRFAKMVTN